MVCFLRQLSNDFVSEYDYILIDSRTGISDTSGICTVQMPDELVVCFTLNNQSIRGAVAVAESACRQRRRPTGESGLRVWPVPTRVELGEKKKLEAARARAQVAFDPFLMHMTVAEKNAYWDAVETLYHPWYAYEEVLAVYGDQPGVKTSLLAAAEALTGYLTYGEIRAAVVPSEEERQRIGEQFARDGSPRNITFDVFIACHPSDAEKVIGEIVPSLESASLKVLIANRDFGLGTPLISNVQQAIAISRHTLVVLTQTFVNSAEFAELEAILTKVPEQAERKPSVVPILLAECTPPKWIASLSYADLTQFIGRVEEMSRLLRRLGATLPGPMHSEEMIGATLAGKYQLTAEIGEGGMGVIYRAQQKQPVRRQVAIKLIKPGMDSREVLAHFDAERQALALMDHPNIARILDGGAAASGRPYFVMEYVNGIPITRYCDLNKLTPLERLTLFIPVCHAVQHAHQRGIIHRDIKPNNVLVELIDGQSIPKIVELRAGQGARPEADRKDAFHETRQYRRHSRVPFSRTGGGSHC